MPDEPFVLQAEELRCILKRAASRSAARLECEAQGGDAVLVKVNISESGASGVVEFPRSGRRVSFGTEGFPNIRTTRKGPDQREVITEAQLQGDEVVAETGAFLSRVVCFVRPEGSDRPFSCFKRTIGDPDYRSVSADKEWNIHQSAGTQPIREKTTPSP